MHFLLCHSKAAIYEPAYNGEPNTSYFRQILDRMENLVSSVNQGLRKKIQLDPEKYG